MDTGNIPQAAPNGDNYILRACMKGRVQKEDEVLFIKGRHYRQIKGAKKWKVLYKQEKTNASRLRNTRYFEHNLLYQWNTVKDEAVAKLIEYALFRVYKDSPVEMREYCNEKENWT